MTLIQNIFHGLELSVHRGTCRDNGIVIFEDTWTTKQMNDWMKTFQFKVNDPCGDED